MRLDDEVKVTPTPAELAVVGALQRNGAPLRVEFVEQDSGFFFPGWVERLIRFISPEGKEYEATSWRVQAWPQVSFVEMQALGMIRTIGN